MAAESGTGSDEERRSRAAPPGWRHVEASGAPGDIFVLDPERPDYPEQWRSREEQRERKTLDQHSAARSAASALKNHWAEQGFDAQSWGRLVEHNVRASEVEEFTGKSDLTQLTGHLRDAIYSRTREAAEKLAPAAGVSYVTALRYLAEHTLPAELVLYVVDEIPEPIKIAVNADPHRRLLLTLSPGETMVRFGNIARRDLNHRLGHFITEALEIADPERRRTRGKRRSLNESGSAAPPELIARLFHWEGWSHRRIAAFLGWLKPTDDWGDPRVRARIEQRVRRYVRLGEGALQLDLETDNHHDDDESGGEAWKRRPPALDQAIRSEGRRERRR